MMAKKKTARRGPKPEVLKLEKPVDWVAAMRHALAKKKPVNKTTPKK